MSGMTPATDSPASVPPSSDLSSDQIAVCVKWTALQIHVDPISGTVQPSNHESGFSEADLAAVETALQLAEEWSAAGSPTSVVAICVGADSADGGLRDLLACGVTRAVRIAIDSHDDVTQQPTSAAVAALLASHVAGLGVQLVICGDVSADRGSGSVPAFLAHRMRAAQALGLIEVSGGTVGTVSGVRRLDGARRELLHVSTPAVVSVEGAVADLRRATLPATIAARSASIEVRPIEGPVETDAPRTSPWRPRARVIPAPDSPDALSRIVELTGAKSDRASALTVHLEPAAAAQAIVEKLEEWGYLGDASTDRPSEDR